MITQNPPLTIPSGRTIEIVVSKCSADGHTLFQEILRRDFTDVELAFCVAETSRGSRTAVTLRPKFNEGGLDYREWRSINGEEFREIWFRMSDYASTAADSDYVEKPVGPVVFTYWDLPRKNGGITFEASTEQEASIASSACRQVMEAARLNPFHQMGNRNEPGEHAWEQWSDMSREGIEALLPKVQTLYADTFKMCYGASLADLQGFLNLIVWCKS